ncbi:MAG: alpha/beta hydrolase [Pseudomonadota bacterium]
MELVLDDGTVLGAFWVRSRRNAPTLLYLHGDAENVCDQLYFWPAAAHEAGLNCLFLDYPGFSTSQGWPSLGNACTAARLALRFLLQQPSRRVPGVVVMGRSLGSVFALDLVRRTRSPRLRGLVLESALADLAGYVASVTPFAELGLDGVTCEAQLRRDFDAREALARVCCPVLVLHGRDDTILPVSHAHELARWAGLRLWRQVLFDEGGHNALFSRHRAEYVRLLQELLATPAR